MASKTAPFRVGRVRAYRRGRVWYLAYSEHGQRRQPRVGPDRDVARQMAAEINGQQQTGTQLAGALRQAAEEASGPGSAGAAALDRTGYPQSIPVKTVDELLAEGLATKTSDGKYVMVHDTADGHLVDFLLEEYQPVEYAIADGPVHSTRAYGGPVGQPVYRMVYARTGLALSDFDEDGADVGQIVARGRTTAYADVVETAYDTKLKAQGLAQVNQALAITEGAVTFVAKMTPIVGTAYTVVKQYQAHKDAGVIGALTSEDAVLSAAGDVAFFLSFGASRIAQAGNASRELILTARGLNAAAGGTQLGITVYNIKQGVDALDSGNHLGAAAAFGEATLRLFGAAGSAFNELRLKAAVAKPAGSAPSNLPGGAKTATEVAQELGKAGEKAAGIAKNTQRIESLSGKAAYRIPDELTATTLTEVKNVAYQHFSTQLRDSLHYSMMTGRQMILKVRPDTVLSKDLQDVIKAGWIKLEFIP